MRDKLATLDGLEAKRETGLNSKENTFVVKKKKHPRIWVKLPLDYFPMDGEERLGGIVMNAGEGGLFDYVSQAIEIRTLLKIEILFPKGLELDAIRTVTKAVYLDFAEKGLGE